LSWLTATSVALGVPGFVTLCGLLLFAAVSSRIEPGALVWAAVPISAWALLQATGHDVFEWADVARWCGGMRPFATLGHPTQLGVWMAAMTVFALELGRRASRGFFFVAGLTAVVCAATLSRAGWLALLVGVLAYALLVAARRAVTPRQVLGSGLLLGLAAGLVSALVGVDAVLERVTNVLVAPTRLALWRTALAAFGEHPLLGWGFDNFLLVDQQLRQPEAWKYEWGVTAAHAHSFPAQVLATQGLIGALVMVAVVVLVLVGWRRGGAHRTKPAEVAVTLALVAAAQVTFLGVLGSALLLMVVVRSLDADDAQPLPAWSRLLAVPFLAVTLVMLSASMVGRSDEGLATATRLEPWNPTWPALLGASLEERGQLDEARAAYETAVSRVPTLAVSSSNVGRVASKQHDAATSRDAFERARRLAPLDARIALESAEASLRLGDLELAGATLEWLLRTYPSDGPAWFTLGRVRVLQHRRLEARAMLEASLEMDWRDWPEGLGASRRLLAAVLLEAGLDDAAVLIARGPEVAQMPADACGAPARLR
ncbi:MAG: O-antigen ligase family protein, partial [Archangium sp.]|nr:O-antigen ligase family protein [Archangium sp.]